MTFDCFTFCHELDILELRLETLNPVVDRFVLVEGTHTFSGKPKPLFFQDNQDRFAPYRNKISPVTVEGKYDNPWPNEHLARNSIYPTLPTDPTTLILLSDVDEIPRPEVVLGLSQHWIDKPSCLLMDFHPYFLNLRLEAPDTDYCRHGTIAFRVRDIGLKNIQWFRDNRHSFIVIPNGGWHLSYMGGAKAVQQKLQSYSHAFEKRHGDIRDGDRPLELIQEYIDSAVAGSSIWGPTHQVPLEELPPVVQANPTRWKEYLLDG